jgi:chromosomal replication initiator protein
VSTPVIDYIAATVDKSIRDLEGVLTSLMAYSVVNNCEIDLGLAERVISRTVGISRQHATLSLEDILTRTCHYFSIDREDVLSSTRKAPVVLARQVVMYLAQQHTRLSTTKIGAFVGKRGHATVLHSCQAVSQRLQADDSFRERIEELEGLLMQ